MSRKTKTAAREANTTAAGTNANATEQALFACSRITHPAAESTSNIDERHPTLVRMFVAVEAMLDRNEPDAWRLLNALCVLNGSASFRREFDRDAIDAPEVLT